MGEVRVIESDPLGERIKKFCCARRAYVIAGAVLLVVVVIVITVTAVLINRNNSSGIAIDYSKALLVTDDRNLWALDLNSSNRTILAKSRSGIDAYDLYRRSTIFYHERTTQWIASLSSKYRNLTQTQPWLPTSLAVDGVTGNVYAVDALAGKLNVYRLDSARFGIALADLREPRDLALDSARGVMFVLQKRHSILKVNMDGSSPRKIVVNSSLVSLTAETQTATLYYSTVDEIRSCDYSGENQRSVVRTSSTAFSLAVSGTRLFWAQAPLNTGFGTLWACSVTGGNCSGQEEFDFVDPRNVRVYEGDYSSGLANPCEESTTRCDQLCLLKPDGGRSCACYVGYELDDDDRSCRAIDEYLLYTRGEFVRGRATNARRTSFADAIEPFAFPSAAGELRNKTTVDFDYNYRAGKIAIGYDDRIEVMELGRAGAPERYSRDGCVKQVAYDWVTDDVYYVRDTCDVAFTSGILVFQPRQWTYRTKILQIFAEGNGHPRALAMHPNNGMYFFTMKRAGSASIFRIRGAKTTPIANENVNETALTIDFYESRLYWFSADLKFVRSADFEGKDGRAVDVSVIDEPRSISLDDRYIYLSNLTSIWRVIKSSGRGAVKLVPTYDDDNADKLISTVKVYGKEAQPIDGNNPCAVTSNGGCEEFCFRTPFILSSGGNAVNDTGEVQKTCSCENYKTIKPDGRSCDFERVTQDPRIYGHVR